ncbi:F11 receptor, tandem duplicate 1 [Gymnodraco acuticeps]|uniref:Junctional adhesion molecule A n=1 Tax=Gymnodraco acuticeps TaxID=8218 RepID=A0A6P8WG82_GYMAC|nr:F11 receptor, tandem duplicate 1 [Gymnodraco acuticeps]XP_034096445.1 F11 receptor, tandem duplicate 1 [Gymnodraco acuticeps]
MFSTGLVSVALFFLSATGVRSFSVTTTNNNVRVKENEGTDLTCSYSADFGSSARLEWKFKDIKGSQTYVVFDGKPTQPYAGRVTMYGNNLRINKVTRKDNGVYDCEVSAGEGQFGEVRVQLTVMVPPSPPMCRIPSSVTTGKVAMLTCHDGDGSPPPTYKWYKDKILMPADPSKIAGFRNATYKLSAVSGNLEYPAVTKMDSGQYYCEAVNDAGPPQRCKGLHMEVRDVNTGGIVAGVIVALLLLLLLGLGIWYAHKKGYFPKKAESKPKTSVVYQPTSLHSGDGGGGDDEDGEFKQKSSFVV